MDLTEQAVTEPGPYGPPEPGPPPEPYGLAGTDRPKLARHVRLAFDKRRDRPVLLLPETVVVLNATGAAILKLCDGQRTVTEIVAGLAAEYAGVREGDVRTYLAKLIDRRCVEVADG